MRIALPALSWLLLPLLASSCAGPSRVAFPIDDLLALDPDPRAHQVLHAGDALEIRFERTPELNVTLPVRPDGTIKLPLSDTLRAAGRTPEELEREIELQYGRELRAPDATVVVQEFAGRTVHVGGEVEEPGSQVLTAPLTLLEAIIAAGGPRETAYLSQVLLVRTFDSGERRIFEVDLRAITRGHALPSDVFLRPTDIVYLPRSPISGVNKWVDQYIRQNIPFAVSLRPDVGFR